jgi:predicted PurR-regulated permease PerM
LAQAAAVGVVAWGLCYSEDVAAPIVVGVAVASLSVVPGFGILVGGSFGLLLEAGLGTADGVLRLGIAFVLLQIANSQFTRRVVVPRSLVVGPAVIVIAVIVGFDFYGIGGSIYTAILAIFATAVLEAAGQVFDSDVDPEVTEEPSADEAGGPQPEPAPAGHARASG